MNAQPSTKTNLTVLAGAIVTIITAVLTSVWGIEVPPEVTAAAVTLVTGLIAYFVPAKQGRYVYMAQDDGYLPAEDMEAEPTDDEDEMLLDYDDYEDIDGPDTEEIEEAK